MISIQFAVHTVSELNAREHWAVKAKRAKLHRSITKMVVGAALTRDLKMPVLVTLTRVGKRKLDQDNLAASFKHVQDGVADALRVDDGDEGAVLWRYRQEIGKSYSIHVDIEQCACVAMPPARDGATGYYDSRACPVHGRRA